MDNKYTDLVIRLGEHEWCVHKVVVGGRSDFFAKACDGAFKVSRSR